MITWKCFVNFFILHHFIIYPYSIFWECLFLFQLLIWKLYCCLTLQLLRLVVTRFLEYTDRVSSLYNENFLIKIHDNPVQGYFSLFEIINFNFYFSLILLWILSLTHSGTLYFHFRIMSCSYLTILLWRLAKVRYGFDTSSLKVQ